MRALNRLVAADDAAESLDQIFRNNLTVRAHASAPHLAVAVSGGPDSMALLHLLSRAVSTSATIHAITVDHGLRAGSAVEASNVGEWLRPLRNVEHHILRWDGVKPDSALMEEARSARYRLMGAWCAARDIAALWLGHNRTDQAETVLFRLAKGSGLDGLAAMQAEQDFPGTDVTLLRPLLDIAKDDLTAWCVAQNIPFVTDPSNANPGFARVRLRQSLDALAAEGLSEKRLAATARRMGRARAALDHFTDQAWEQVAAHPEGGSAIEVDLHALAGWPPEIRLRVIRRACMNIGGGGFGPRLDALERIVDDIFADHAFRAATLGGLLLRRVAGRDSLRIAAEDASTPKIAENKGF